MTIDFEKSNGLVPVIIQDNVTLEVLMLGYMNPEAYEKTRAEGIVTFYSRTKNRLWTKGETSGNFLKVISISLDCDQDALLILAEPTGNVCHTGDRNCFGTAYGKNFLFKLQGIVDDRFLNPVEGSYVNSLQAKGLNKIAQKVGEEGVEVVIAALAEKEENLVDEASDLLFHLLVLLKEKNVTLDQVGRNLERRHK